MQGNLLAATTQNSEAVNEVYNVAVGDRTTLKDLYSELRCLLVLDFPDLAAAKPYCRDFREGDVRHSEADIGKAASRLGYAPTHRFEGGLAEAISWYCACTPERPFEKPVAKAIAT